MIPTLFEVFGVPIDSYGAMMALGYVLALGLMVHMTPRGRLFGRLPPKEEARQPHRAQLWDLFLVLLLSSILGAKVGHTLFEAPGHRTETGELIGSLWELLRSDPLHWLRIGEAGYVWYGGLFGALLAAWVYFRRRPWLNAWAYADVCAPAVMLGAFVGRLGCFLAGCCHGVPSDLPWAVHFPRLETPVHPTQLYDAGAAALIGTVLYLRYWRRRFDGECIVLLLTAYPVLRASTEFFRGDADRGQILGLSTSQALSIPLLFAGLALYRRLLASSKEGA